MSTVLNYPVDMNPNRMTDDFRYLIQSVGASQVLESLRDAVVTLSDKDWQMTPHGRGLVHDLETALDNYERRIRNLPKPVPRDTEPDEDGVGGMSLGIVFLVFIGILVFWFLNRTI